MQTAHNIAHYLIGFANDHGDFISNLKLQKLLYYAQGWHLAIYGTRLFPDKFQAWVHGPAVPSIYQCYRAFGHRPIEIDASLENLSIRPSLTPQQDEFLNELLGVYFQYNAYTLELMTHRETPWIQARQGIPADEPSQNELDEDIMKAYFTALRSESESAST